MRCFRDLFVLLKLNFFNYINYNFELFLLTIGQSLGLGLPFLDWAPSIFQPLLSIPPHNLMRDRFERFNLLDDLIWL